MSEKYPLDALLNVRHYREKAAERGILAARHALEAAKGRVEAEKRDFEAWRAWRAAEVERRYKALLGHPIPIDGLLGFNNGLAALDARALEFELRIAEAQKALEEETAKLEAAKLAATRARQNAAKIEKHKSIWAEEAKIEAERAEEREFEEFKPLSSPAD